MKCKVNNVSTPNILTDAEAAWIAGILEGEGCWTKLSSDGWAISVGMTDLDVLEKMQNLTGIGNLYSRQPLNENHKLQHAWHVASKRHCEWLSVQVWPWLCSRRRAKLTTIWPGISEVVSVPP